MSDSSMDAEFRSLALAQSSAIKTGLEFLQDFDFTKGYELDRRLKADPNLLAEFVQNPTEVAKREVDLEPPPGFHMHFITENNEYMPAEGDALSQLWKSGLPLDQAVMPFATTAMHQQHNAPL
jgi:hypothetical protein